MEAFVITYTNTLNKLIEEQLGDVFNEQKGIDSIRYFEELRDEMAKKGLTQEILDDILNDEG